jgi:hypothetical protein
MDKSFLIMLGVVVSGILIEKFLSGNKWLMPISTPAIKPPKKDDNKSKECKLHDWVNCPMHEENDPNAHLICNTCGKVPSQ